VRAERIGLMNHAVSSYSAGTERTVTADHSQFNVCNVDRLRQAWTSAGNLPPGDAAVFPTGKPPLPPLSRGSNFSDVSQHHVPNKKEEDLSEEWLALLDSIKLKLELPMQVVIDVLVSY